MHLHFISLQDCDDHVGQRCYFTMDSEMNEGSWSIASRFGDPSPTYFPFSCLCILYLEKQFLLINQEFGIMWKYRTNSLKRISFIVTGVYTEYMRSIVLFQWLNKFPQIVYNVPLFE